MGDPDKSYTFLVVAHLTALIGAKKPRKMNAKPMLSRVATGRLDLQAIS
jgi:hypothetical protein